MTKAETTGGASASPSRSAVDAAAKLADWVAVRSPRYRAAVIRTSWDMTHPDILRFYKALNAALKERAYPFYAFEFWRSPARQTAVKAAGNSKAGAWSSPHQYGCAVDVIHLTRSWDLSRTEWALIGLIGKEVARKLKIKVVWGGDFKSLYDPAHWELENWRSHRDAVRRLWDAAEGGSHPADRTGLLRGYLGGL